MSVPKFWVPYLKWDAFVADAPAETGGDADTDPQQNGIHAGVEITAKLSKGDYRAIRALTAPMRQLFALGSQDCRLDNGYLKLTAAQQEFGLLAKCSVLDLPEDVDIVYSFRPHHVTYNGTTQDLPTITVKAPVVPDSYDPAVSGPFQVNLAEMEWLNDSTAAKGGFIIRQVPDDVTQTGDDIQFWASGSPLGAPITLPAGGGGGGPANTDALPEGTTNLYYTSGRVDARIAAANLVGKAAASTAGFGFVDDDETLAAASATKLATQRATRAFTLAKIAELIGAAPAELDTWIELVSAIQADQSAIAGINTALAARQDKDATLTALAAVVTAADKLIYATGADTFATTTLTGFMRTLLATATALDAQSALGLGSLATVTPTGPATSGTVLYGDGVYRTPPSGGGGGSVDSVASLPGPDITAEELANQLVSELITPTLEDMTTRDDIAPSAKLMYETITSFASIVIGNVLDQVVKLAGDESIDGSKTFLSDVRTHNLFVNNNPGDTARVVLGNTDADQIYEFGTNVGGQFTVWDSTGGRGPLSIDPGSPGGALEIHPTENIMQTPLNMGGNKIGNGADPVSPQDFGTKSYIDAKVAGIVNSAPATLDTLDELAAALGDDPSFATTVSTNIGLRALKATKVNAGTGLTGGGDLSADRTVSVQFGSIAGTVAQGNDPRLSDARTPLAHNHVVADTTGLQAALDAKAAKLAGTSVIAGVNASGVETAFPYSASAATANSVVLRDANGAVVVATPTAPGHAATKAYADSLVPQPATRTGIFPFELCTQWGPWASTPWHVRKQFRIANEAKRFRVHVRNRVHLTDTVAAGTVTGVTLYAGAAAKDANGLPNGNFTAAPVQIQATTTIVNGTELITPWVTPAQLTIKPHTDYLVSIGFTTPSAANQIAYSGGFCWQDSTPANAGVVAPNPTRTNNGSLLETWIEYEFANDHAPSILVVGNSLSSPGNGNGTDHNGEVGSWHQLWAQSTNGVAASIAVATAWASIFPAGNNRWDVYNTVNTPMDYDAIVYWAANSSDTNQVGGLASGKTAHLAMLARGKALWPNARHIVTNNPARAETTGSGATVDTLEYNRVQSNIWLHLLNGGQHETLDLDSLISDRADPARQKAELTADGTHMNPRGHQVMAGLARQAIPRRRGY